MAAPEAVVIRECNVMRVLNEKVEGWDVMKCKGWDSERPPAQHRWFPWIACSLVSGKS